MPESISVKQLNLYVKSLLESDKKLNFVSVYGEISNFKNHYASGHLYFTVKDKDAAIRCVMFSSAAKNITFEPKDGTKVIISGRVSVYEKDGQYQFYVTSMTEYGEGELSKQFKLTKEKLEKEGLFAEESKRTPIKFPKKIAVITSKTGAAVHDICSTLQKRWPVCEIVLCPVLVQGENAPLSMINALDTVYGLDGIDTIIIGRGGGASEDLSAFNDESLARKIYESPVPVISGVGHETDFTICDFVSDIRAATPTAAAILASVDINDIKLQLDKNDTRLNNAINSTFERLTLKLNALKTSRALSDSLFVLEQKMQTVLHHRQNLCSLINKTYEKNENDLKRSIALLDGLSPLKTLKRGYAIALKEEKTVKSVKDINKSDKLSLKFADGSAECEVINVKGEF